MRLSTPVSLSVQSPRGRCVALPSRVIAVEHVSVDALVARLHRPEQHPGMPAGIVKLVWRQVRGGQPSAFYAGTADPDEPWVLYVLIPVEDQVLIVALHPTRADLIAEAEALYRSTRALEARLAGMPRAKVAERCAAHLRDQLRGAGIGDIGELSARIIEREVIPACLGWPGKPRLARRFGPLASLQGTVQQIRGNVGGPARGLARLTPLAADLRECVVDLNASLSGLRVLTGASTTGAHQVAAHAPVLANTAEALTRVGAGAQQALSETVTAIGEASVRLTRARQWIGAANLVNDLLAWEVDRMLVEHAPAGVPERLGRLCQALQHATIEMAVELTELPGDLDAAAAAIERSMSGLADFHRWLSRFRLLVTRAGLWRELVELTAELDRQLVGVSGLERLGQFGARLRGVDVGVDIDGLASGLEQVREALLSARSWPSGVLGGCDVP